MDREILSFAFTVAFTVCSIYDPVDVSENISAVFVDSSEGLGMVDDSSKFKDFIGGRTVIKGTGFSALLVIIVSVVVKNPAELFVRFWLLIATLLDAPALILIPCADSVEMIIACPLAEGTVDCSPAPFA